MLKQITIKTHARSEMLDITSEINNILATTEIKNGLCYIYVPHTTAGVTINENADPDVTRDILMELDKIVPWSDGYKHAEGNSAAHIKASMMGYSQMVIIDKGKLVLGTWQGIYFCEFDGPRTRKIFIKMVAD